MEYTVYYGCVPVARFEFIKDAKKFLKRKKKKSMNPQQYKLVDHMGNIVR